MDNVWIGRKLTAASDALAERYVGLTLQAGEASKMVAALAPQLLAEIGRGLSGDERDPRQPFARSNGLMRLPAELEETMIARAFNGLAALVSHYICALPGATGSMDRFARDSVRHAAKVTMQLRRELLRGERRGSTEACFGGVAMLVYPTQQPQAAV